MSEPLLVACAFGAALIALRVALTHARYRAIYRYAEADLQQARRDAARRSRAGRSGRSVEQLSPLTAEFARCWDPADARFLGAPVDFVVFDGLAAGELREIVLVEVKSGRGQPNGNELQVREAVERGLVTYELLRF